MRPKQPASRRRLIAEPLEKRELLAADFRGHLVAPPDAGQLNAARLMQRQAPVVVAEATSTCRAHDHASPDSDANANREHNHGEGEDSASSLSQTEIEQLLFTREEEKLARDVYLALAEASDSPIFANIAESEQNHMDAVGKLIDKYGLEDPVKDNTPGVFTNETLQRLYNDLVSDREVDLSYLGLDLTLEGGATSPLAALKVGAFIEELDILDLQNAIDATTHSDVERVYESLLEGSLNHFRAFVGQIEKTGETYEPVLLTGDSHELYEEIISEERDSGSNGHGADEESRDTGERGRKRTRASNDVADEFFASYGQRQAKRRSR